MKQIQSQFDLRIGSLYPGLILKLHKKYNSYWISNTKIIFIAIVEVIALVDS